MSLQKVYMKTPVVGTFLSNVSGWKAVNLLKECFQHRCFSVNFLHIFGRSFLHNSFGWLLQNMPRHRIRKLQFCNSGSRYQVLFNIKSIFFWDQFLWNSWYKQRATTVNLEEPFTCCWRSKILTIFLVDKSKPSMID